ncbi:unnamed protein product, partial [Amoebophrya sp. A25]
VTDKTGTLTANEMRFHSLANAQGEILFTTSTASNNSPRHPVLGNPNLERV